MNIKTFETAGTIARKGDRIISRMALLLAILLLLYSSYTIWDNYMIEKRAFASNDLMRYKPTREKESFSELKKINPDVIAWLTIPKTHIDYPVLQGKTNQEYLNKGPKGDFSISGSIFIDSQNSKEMTDQYLLLFGHHLHNGAMFGDVVKFVNKKYFDNRKTGTLMTERKKYKIKFFAVLRTTASNELIYNTSNQSQEKLAQLISYINENAVQKRDIKISDKDKIVALSTCTEATTNGRIVLFGRLI
ncbi:class B sortase [Eubacteriales bacterium KG127]